MNDAINKPMEPIEGDTPEQDAVLDLAAMGVASDDETHGLDKFTAEDIATLRTDLLQAGLDSFQSAEIVTTFLCGRGYGISADEARVVASSIEGASSSVVRLQAELERVARAA